MAFPYAEYEAFLTGLVPAGATLFWKGDPEPFYTPVGDNFIVVKIDVGTSYGYGTSEVRRTWVPSVQNGDGAYATYVLQRMTWPLTIDIETLDTEAPGETFIMELRGKIRWPTSIQKIQDMGLTTIKVGNVIAATRELDDHDTFAATLNISHGQCFVSEAVDDDGNVIDLVLLQATLTGGNPDPVTFTQGPYQVGT